MGCGNLPELLGITNPVPGYDSHNHQRNIPLSPGSTVIQNVPDPNRVNRADVRSEQQDAGERSQTPRFDSNFQTFLQRLKEMPQLSLLLSRVLSGKTMVSSGMEAGVAQELSRFLEMLRMDRSQFLRFLSDQFAGGSRFGGPLFSILRSEFQKADSEGLRSDLLQFLKRYSDFSSTRHLEGNLLRNLNQMARAIPRSWGNGLIDLIAKLQNGVDAGDRAGNLKLLQGEILPYMSEYVSRTHDLGRARGLLSQVTLDISRYENGSETALLQAFHQLKNYTAIRDRLGGLDDASLLTLLRNTPFEHAAQGDDFVKQLAILCEQGLRGAGGTEAQQVFRELVSAILINESVYMPVNHYMIPLEWEGKTMFSEVWVDPDAEPDGTGREGERTLRFLFKVDIQSLGYFDILLTCRGEAVDLHVQCPEKLVPFAPIAEQQLGRILSDHGYKANSVRVKKMERPFTISEVFPKIYVGKDSVNVKV